MTECLYPVMSKVHNKQSTMKSRKTTEDRFYNWYGVTKQDKSYQIIADNNIINTLETVFETDDLKSTDLKAAATRYLLDIGLSEKEIEDIKANLSEDYSDQ